MLEHGNSVFIHPSSIVEDPSCIGSGTSIWHFCHLMANIKIGNQCTLGQNVFVADHVTLGDNVKVQNNVSLYTGVICEDNVFLGPSMVFTNVINPRSAINRKNEFKKTLVQQGASIGANATIICGITIGSYAMIGAGSVVTKSVKPYALVLGNPAKQTGWISSHGHKLSFDKKGIAICPMSKEEYRLSNENVSLIRSLSN